MAWLLCALITLLCCRLALPSQSQGECSRSTSLYRNTWSCPSARAYIEPPENIDISNNTVGDTISIGCSIQTCAVSIDISILKGSQSILQRKNIADNVVLLNHDLVIQEDTPGVYACVVLVNGQQQMERFNITGTPRPAPMSPFAP